MPTGSMRLARIAHSTRLVMEYDAVNGLSGARSRWTIVDGRRMHARVWEGPPEPPATYVAPIVLVHGLAVSSRYFAPTAVRLARHLPVLAPDLPGWGRSDKPVGVLQFPELADALAGWMRQNDIQRAALVGNSMGCQVITHLAVRHPALVERAVLVGPTMDRRARTLPRQAWRLFLDMLREPPWTWVLHARDLVDFGPPRTLAYARLALSDRPEDQLPSVEVPALVIRGSRDAIVSHRWAEEVAGLLPHGRFVTAPGAAHAVNTSAPDTLTRLMLPFLLAPPAESLSKSHRTAETDSASERSERSMPGGLAA
jgi:2-hydroxy-6-oxonona-2,4-dienedioate hydrolase